MNWPRHLSVNNELIIIQNINYETPQLNDDNKNEIHMKLFNLLEFVGRFGNSFSFYCLCWLISHHLYVNVHKIDIFAWFM